MRIRAECVGEPVAAGFVREGLPLLDSSAAGDPPAQYRSPGLLRLALGIVYLHFGFLKLFPDLSPAEMIASQTIMRISGNLLDAHTALIAVGLLECAIGLGFFFGVTRLWLPLLFLVHMAGTALPLFILPEFTFKIAPFAPTLEGQYILKNLVFVAAGWTVLVPRIDLARWVARTRAAIDREPGGRSMRAKV